MNSHHYIKSLVKLSTTNYNIRNWLWCWEYIFPNFKSNENENLKIFGCDYSKVAVDLVKSNESFISNHEKGVAYSSVWDLANPEGNIPEDLPPNSVDIVIMVFVFLALHPDQWKQAVDNLSKVLKPGGEILFRDYGRYDLAQVRFKKVDY